MTDSRGARQRWTRRPEGSNWGDFGVDDQVGRMNLITPELRLAAVREVREGRAFALSLPLDYPGGGEGSGRHPPRLFANRVGGAQVYNLPLNHTDICCDDSVTMSLQYSTQWDSLAHWGRMFDVDGSGEQRPVYYNGYRAEIDIVCSQEDDGPHADRLGIENLAVTGVQGRGVLIDLAAVFGTGPTKVDYAKLCQAIAEQEVDVRSGDFLLLYTGYCDAVMAMRRQPDEGILHQTGAALDGSDDKLLDWIDKSGIVAIASDNPAVETFEFGTAGPNGMLPLHDRCLFKLGIHLGELWWLSELAHYLRHAGRHAFLLTAPPLRLPGAVGSPVNPIATV